MCVSAPRSHGLRLGLVLLNVSQVRSPVGVNFLANDTGRNFGIEINIDKSQVMRVSRRNESLLIKESYRELKC